MEALGRAIEGLAIAYKVKEFFDPANRNPKEEPFKRYTYEKNGKSKGAVPYKTEWPGKTDFLTKARMTQGKMQNQILGQALKTVKFLNNKDSDSYIDDFLIELIGKGSFGFGF